MTICNTIANASHLDSISFRTGTIVEPVAQVSQHLIVILKPRTKAESVIASRVGVVCTLVASIVHSLIICKTIGYRVYQRIIAGCYDNGRRSEVATNGIVSRILSYQLRILLSFLAQEVLTRPLMGYAFVHRDNRIEKYAKVGTGIKVGEGRDD